MPQPIVIAHHLIWTAYGWWLPNDPRGSGSKVIRRDVIADLGELHEGRKKIQPPSRVVREFYQNAAQLLKHPLLTFDEPARNEIGNAFADVIQNERYTCYACAIMADHIHILIRKHKHTAEQMAAKLKTQSRLRLSPLHYREDNHPTWTAGTGWKVFLDHPDEVWRTIKYIDKTQPLALSELVIHQTLRQLATAPRT
jgi:REP element-mobilizing transposase RayT